MKAGLDPQGSQPVAYSPIDSDRFGIRVARASVDAADIDDVLAWCDLHPVDLLIVRIPAAGTFAVEDLESRGLAHMETLVGWILDLDRSSSSPDRGPCGTRIANGTDSELVGNLARWAFHGYVGHYHRDPRLDETACDELYADWAARECRQSGDRHLTLIAEAQGQSLGFTSARINDRGECEAVLSGVLPEARRRGVFSSLHKARLGWCRMRGIRRMTAFTVAANTAMLRCYERAGFVAVRRMETFHKWYR